MSIPYCALESKVSAIHNPHDARGYVDWHSWAAYLDRHPGYKSYQPVTDIKKYGCNWGTWITFPQKIEAIQARVGNISSPLELFRSKDFLVMYKHPSYYEETCFNYIEDKRYSLEQKKIAIYATMGRNWGRIWQRSYQLYKKKKIDLPLLEAIVAIAIANDFDTDFGFLEKMRKEDYAYLERIQNNIPKESSFYKYITYSLSNNKLPKSWCKYRIHSPADPPRDYYNDHFPFYDILSDAVRDIDYVIDCYGTPSFGLESYPYFLIVMEHPKDYYPAHFELGPRRAEQDKPKRRGNGIDILRYKGYTDEEKSTAIFGMSQLGVTDRYESSNYYAFIIEHAIEWYKLGNLSVHHLLELFICNFPTFYKYPFFILDYKEQAIQRALNKFIAEPTIPEGIKEVARKVKNGILATKEEMNYMEGYRTFRKTHFTLYETIVPHG